VCKYNGRRNAASACSVCQLGCHGPCADDTGALDRLVQSPVRPLLALEQDSREGRDEGRGESATVPSATAAVAEAVKVWAKDVGITEAQRASAVTYKTTGEDAAAFSWEAQQDIQWIRFVAAVSTVRGALFISICILILIYIYIYMQIRTTERRF
tara:strand:+ start:262 stop:726 length:465 start_codon:yes stop_codon:yes gene_type:complete